MMEKNKNSNIEFKVNIVLKTLILVVIIFIANYFLSNKIIRYDLTEDKIFTISNVTKKILKDLQDYVNIEVYFSEKLPQQLLHVRQEIEDILKEYEAYSDNKIKVKFIDPASSPELREKVVRSGVPEVQMNIFEKDERKVINGFLGLAIFYEDKTSVIPVIQQTENLEYELTSGIRRVTLRDIPKIGFFTDKESKNIFEQELETVSAELRKQFQIEAVALDGGKNTISDDLNLLVIAGPQTAFNEREKFEIDQYIMSGGKVIFLINGIKVEPNLTATPLDVNLNDMLANYGILLNNNLVLDKINEHAAFRTGYVQYVQPYPYFVKPVKRPGWSGFNSEHPVTSKMESMIFQWVSSVDTYPVENGNANYKVLIKSSPNSWEARSNFYQLHPQSIAPPQSMKSYNLVMLAEGTFKSFFAGKEIPKLDLSDTEAELFIDERLKDKIKENSDTTHIIVVGNSDFITQNVVNQNPNNLNFILNLIDWLALDNSLIDIRSKTVIMREIKDLSESKKNWIRILNIYTIPALVILFGIVRHIIKKRRRYALLVEE
jgi:ABC-2 type transport system permease protein